MAKYILVAPIDFEKAGNEKEPCDCYCLPKWIGLVMGLPGLVAMPRALLKIYPQKAFRAGHYVQERLQLLGISNASQALYKGGECQRS